MPHTRNEVIIAVNPYIVYLSAIKCNCGSNIFMSAMQHCHYYCSRAGHQLRKGSLSHLWPWQATDHPDGKRFNSSLGMVVILLCFVLGDTNIRVVEATRVSTGLSLPPNGGHLLANRCWFPDPRNAGEVRRVIRWASCSIFDVQCNSVLFTMIKSERHVRGGSLRSARAHPDNRAPVPFSATTPTSTEYISSPTGTAAKLDALVQATDKGSQNILYFAYGANMNPSVLTGKRGVTPLASLPAQAIAFADNGNGKRPRGSIGHGGGRHPGMCLCFCHRAGYATIATVPGPPQSWEVSPGVHGVLFVLSPSGIERISASETGYRKRVIEVETSTGRRVNALCYVSETMQMLPTSVPPTFRYLSLIRDGASHHGINEHYQAWLDTLPTVPSRDAEARPERTNTPSKTIANVSVVILMVSAIISGVIYFQ